MPELFVSKEQDKYIKKRRELWYKNEARLNGCDSVKDLLKKTDKALATNNPTDVGTLPRDVWGMWDREALEISQKELVIYNDLVSSVGMSIPVGKTVHNFRRTSLQEAPVVGSFDGRQRPEIDIHTTDYVGTAVPFYANAWGFGWAEYEAAVSEGFTDIDTIGRRQTFRKHAEKMEDICVNGDSAMVYNGTQVYGLTNFTKRKTITKGVTNLNGATGPQWKAEIAKIVKTFSDQHKYQNITLYVNFDDWRYAQTKFYDPDDARFSMQKIADEVQLYPQIGSVIANKTVPANTIIALTKDTDTISLLSRMPLTIIPIFRLHPHDEFKFEVWGSLAPEFKYTMPAPDDDSVAGSDGGREQIGLTVYS